MKTKFWLSIGIVTVLIGCFLFVSRINPVLGRVLLTIGVLFEIVGAIKFVKSRIKNRA